MASLDIAKCLALALAAPANDLAAFYERIEEAKANGDVDGLVALERAAREAAARRSWVTEAVVRALALVPGAYAASRTLAVLEEGDWLGPARDGVPHQHPNAGARVFAAILAQTHDVDVLGAVLRERGEAPTFADLFACWSQEAVLRGRELVGPGAPASIAELYARLAASRHPLAAMPLARLGIEERSDLHASSYGARMSAAWSSDVPLCGADVAPPTSNAPAASIIDVTAPSDARLAAIFESHALVSNGKSEARVFVVSPPVPAGPPTAALLGALPLACLEGCAHGSLRLRALGAEQTYCALLAFGSNGGDYNRAWSGAYGRLAAWRSLAGLVDAPAHATLHAIEADALAVGEGGGFVHFEAQAPWFYRIVTDLGLAVVRRDRQSIAILAGTDTD